MSDLLEISDLHDPEFRQLPYHERFARVKHSLVRVFVLAASSKSSLAPRSGIVGVEMADGHILAYYEGWVHGAMQYADLDVRGQWEAAVDHAAGRMLTGYPTSAMRSFEPSELVEVGIYDPAARSIEITDPEAVDSWLGQ